MRAGLLLPWVTIVLSVSACGPLSPQLHRPLSDSASSTSPSVATTTASVPKDTPSVPTAVSLKADQAAALTPARAEATIAAAISRQTGHPTSSGGQSGNRLPLSVCETEGRQNTDWVLNDSGARATYRNRLSTGNTAFEALVGAQGHNPKAQAILLGCQDWVEKHLRRVGQPDRDVALSDRSLTQADCQCISVLPTGDFDWQQRQAYRVINSCDALAVAVRFTGDIATYSPNPTGFSSVAQVGRLGTNQERRVRAPDWTIVSINSYTLRSTAGSLTCLMAPSPSPGPGATRNPPSPPTGVPPSGAQTPPTSGLSPPKISMPDVDLDEVIDLGIGVLGLLNGIAGLQANRPVYTPTPTVRQPTSTYGQGAPPPYQAPRNRPSTITGTQ